MLFAELIQLFPAQAGPADPAGTVEVETVDVLAELVGCVVALPGDGVAAAWAHPEPSNISAPVAPLVNFIERDVDLVDLDGGSAHWARWPLLGGELLRCVDGVVKGHIPVDRSLWGLVDGDGRWRAVEWGRGRPARRSRR